MAMRWVMVCSPQNAGIVLTLSRDAESSEGSAPLEDSVRGETAAASLRIDTSPSLAVCGRIDSDRGQGFCMDARLRGMLGLIVLLAGAAGAAAQSLDGQ